MLLGHSFVGVKGEGGLEILKSVGVWGNFQIKGPHEKQVQLTREQHAF